MSNIGITDGRSRLKLASTNVDDLRSTEKRTEITNTIHNLNADISCIQETHGAVTTATQLIEYIIYQGKAKDKIIDEKPKYAIKHESQQPNHKNGK